MVSIPRDKPKKPAILSEIFGLRTRIRVAAHINNQKTAELELIVLSLNLSIAREDAKAMKIIVKTLITVTTPIS